MSRHWGVILAGGDGVRLRSQTPISQTASTGRAAIASHAASGTPARVSGRPPSRPRRSSQTAALIS